MQKKTTEFIEGETGLIKRSAEHATFNIERVYAAEAKRVYLAWSDPEIKARWFGPSGGPNALSLDYRVGGREFFGGEFPDGTAFSYDATFHEIVPDHRIVYSYAMDFGQTRISVSLVTVEITASGNNGTRLLYTEQGVYLDGADTPAKREQGTNLDLDALGATFSD